MNDSDLATRLDDLENSNQVDPQAWRLRVSALLDEATNSGDRETAVRAALALSVRYLEESEMALAKQMYVRAERELGDLEAPLLRARLVLVREDQSKDPLDSASLHDALSILEGSGYWSEATRAAAILGRAAGDDGQPDKARSYFLRAIGASEASGARVRVSELLCGLARIDIRSGRLESAESLAKIALRRLDGVPLRWARRQEAFCVDCLGDVAASAHRSSDARRHYEDALARLNSLEAGGRGPIRKKLEALD